MVEILKRIEKKKTSKKYESKKNYLNKVIEIQNNELNSLRYKWIKEFVDSYNDRGYLEEEKILLGMLLNYNVYYFNDNYEEARVDYIKSYNQVKDFINSLTDDQIDSNIYFSIAKKCFTESFIDCKKTVILLRKHMRHTDIFDDWKSISFKTFLSEDRLGYLLKEVDEETSITLKKLYKRYDVNISVLDQENIHYYYKYNKIVNVINKMCENICRLQIWNLLEKFQEDIDNCYFTIENNDYQKAFSVSFYVRTKKEDNVNNLNSEVIKFKEIDSDYKYKHSENINHDFIIGNDFDSKKIVCNKRLVKTKEK